MSRSIECDLCGASISTYWRHGGGHLKVKQVRHVSVSRGVQREVEHGDYHSDCWNHVVKTARDSFMKLDREAVR